MYDPTPAPFGEFTRRWTQLTVPARDDHARRLLDTPCAAEGRAHVDRPGLDAGRCYRELLPSVAAGDQIAIGWLATSHRPLLVARGRALLEHDPTEWGAVCLEALHVTVITADLSEVRWLRRRVAQQLSGRVSRAVADHLEQRRREAPIAPTDLQSAASLDVSKPPDAQLELSVALDRAMGRLDAPTRDALRALANHEPLADVAERHGLTHAAVRQRLTRARRRLQPQLANFHRAVA